MATGLLVLTAVAGVAGAVQQRKISKAQRRQNRINNRIAAVSRQRNIRRAVAASRIERAQVLSTGFQLGVSGSTAEQGAVGGIQSDIASNVGFSNLQFTGQQALSSLSDRISGFQQRANTFGAVANLAGTFTGAVGSEGSQNRAALTSLV